MHIEEFREYCLSLPGARESTPFVGFGRVGRDILVFSVGKKMFCYLNIELFDACTVKCAPDRIDELRERYSAVDKPFNGNPRHWISVRFNDDMPDGEIRTLVGESHRLVTGGRSEDRG